MRHPPADQLVVAVKSLPVWGGDGAKGLAHRDLFVRSTGASLREEARRTCQRRKQSRSTSQSSRCGRRTGGLRPTRVPRGVDEVAIEDFETDLKNNLYK